MDFYEVLERVLALLQRHGRLSYRALKVQFELDDDRFELLKEELIDIQQVARDHDGRMLVWTGASAPEPEASSTLPTQHQGKHVEHPLHTASLPPEPPIHEAERRHLTILFADLVDSTKLSSELDAEDYREVVRAYQAACAEVIARFDCHLAQTLGDGLLIYSGYPIAHDNDAERAVRVGLSILDAVKSLNERLVHDKGIRLSMRVGIHTGVVVVGDVGAGSRPEQLALGEVPNVAARMQGLAEPDTLVISAATYRLVQDYFVCDALGEHDLRGVDQPLAVYRVLHESGVQSRVDVASTRGLTPLVGRESEVSLLLDRWRQAKDGQGQLVLLSGDAGIGKSRLVQVLKEHVIDEPHTRWECRSSPYYQNTALYPITDLLQRALQWQPDDAPAQRLEKLEHYLRPYRLPAAETVPLFAHILSLSIPEERYPPLQLSPQRQRHKTLETLVAILLELAERQPLLFVLEDVHWADPTSLEFVDVLIEQIPTTAMCVLLTCRPTFQPSWSHRSYLTEVTLNRLSRNQIEHMAAYIAGGKRLPDDVVAHIIEKTDGVPLFVEEMTKAIVESGLLKKTNGQYELSGSISTLTIPATLQDSLMARLDRLVSAKGIAQLGAVIGRQFSFDLLEAVSQLDASTLQRELGRLVEAELVYQRGVPPHVTYTFKHALVVDAAYASLLKSTRQQYHQRIAQVLQERFPETAETQPELLAHHYLGAGLNEQAIRFFHHAGERANQRSAYQEAIHHLSQGLTALDALPHTSERLQHELVLQAALGLALIATQGYTSPEVERTYTRTRALCQQVGEVPHLPQILLGLTQWCFLRADLQMARELSEELLRLAQRQQDPMLLLWAHCMIGLVLFYTGEVVPAQTHFEQGMTLYDLRQQRSQAFGYGSVDPGVACPAFAAFCLWIRGYPDQAVQKRDQALTLVQELAHPLSLGRVLVWCARLSQLHRQPQATHEWVEAAMNVMTEDRPVWLEGGAILKSWALGEQNPGAEDIRQIRQGLELWRTKGSRLWLPYSLALLIEAYIKTGQTEEGLSALAEALSLIDDTGERFYEAELYRLKGTLLLLRSADNHTEAEASFQQALTIARRQHAKSWELRTATSLARLWHSQNKRQEAYDLLAPVYNWFTEGHDTADLQDARGLLAALEGGR